jgi:hypothetical protein
MRRMVHAACLTLCIANTTLAQARVHRNVVYGMFSGLALLMDVHVPDRPNGLGILLIPGSGFHTAQGYDGASIKDGGSAAFAFLPSILDAGYTVFVVNHRAAPTFRYPRPFRTCSVPSGLFPERLRSTGSRELALGWSGIPRAAIWQSCSGSSMERKLHGCGNRAGAHEPGGVRRRKGCDSRHDGACSHERRCGVLHGPASPVRSTRCAGRRHGRAGLP